MIVAEVNNGGDLCARNIHTIDPNANVKMVRASRGKWTRAEPVASLYAQGRVHHVGPLMQLEDQMTTFLPGDPGSGSPDRLDGCVWALTELMILHGFGEASYDLPPDPSKDPDAGWFEKRFGGTKVPSVSGRLR